MWKISSWDDAKDEGTITGPHLGPLPFSGSGPFTVGEEVTAKLDEAVAGEWKVLSVEPMKAGQPGDSHRAEFDAINALELWDWRIGGIEDGRLTVLGSTDFSYYHKAEVIFHEVSFISCPANFNHALFLGASEDERGQFPEQHEWEGDMFCIVTEYGNGPDGPRYFVCAERVECKLGTVYYYQRENLQRGERIAPWVK